jgi:hypothetical protein
VADERSSERARPMRLSEAEAIAQGASETVRLAITAWAIKNLSEHIKTPGTYRELVHDRLGFHWRTGAYELLLPALEILNMTADDGLGASEGQ